MNCQLMFTSTLGGVCAQPVARLRMVNPSVARSHKSIQRPTTRTRTSVSAPIKEAELETFSRSKVDVTPPYDAPTPTAGTSGRIVLESEYELSSTLGQKLIVGTTTVLLGATLANGLSHISDVNDAAWAVGALVSAYFFSDLGTGIYHWAVDNYGDGNTPIVGGQIAAFQGHHRRPWTITEREFCNNVHKVFGPAAPISAILFASSFFTPSAWGVWSSTFLFLACMSQQFHAWSHMKASELHPAVVSLQNSGVLISRKAHGAHHKAPFEGNYSIVSGWWNPILDGDGGEGSFFRKMEKVIHDQYGVEPRCWSEPRDDWMEEERKMA